MGINRKLFFILLTLLLWLLSTPMAKSNSLALTILNIGEGDAILIKTEQDHVVLIDCGTRSGSQTLLEELSARAIHSIDALIITHPHDDHFGGFFRIARSIKIKRIFDNGQPLPKLSDNTSQLTTYSKLIRQNTSYQPLRRGNVLYFGELKINILWPDENLSEDWNTNSLVLSLEFGKFRALLMGDANLETEQKLLSYKQSQLKFPIIKAGHHGAIDTGSANFINAVSPEVVVVSVDKDNPRGYPNDKTLSRYKSVGAIIYRTDIKGTIEIIGDTQGKYKVTSNYSG